MVSLNISFLLTAYEVDWCGEQNAKMRIMPAG